MFGISNISAYFLSLLISKYGPGEETFSNYQKQRQDKVNYIVNQSWRFGKLSHKNNRMYDYLVQNLFKMIPDSFFLKQYQKLIDIDYIRNEMLRSTEKTA